MPMAAKAVHIIDQRFGPRGVEQQDDLRCCSDLTSVSLAPCSKAPCSTRQAARAEHVRGAEDLLITLRMILHHAILVLLL
eukprot:CAMPEP_0115491916 /NCGR_PEP_ID=MMETSP0271-20121206/63361_1 /TAXON_ID=71861 /ORGANISM="Scrippsiella trochoidea, Strain CCMP3099" /LENGTH=79 /DNA_ID=CAMNT_0002920299 /DNA_START=586 /DNA_END=822 /DNA_ORIENTATION=-